MCMGCWAGEGEPKVDTDEVRALARAARELYHYGPLYAVLENFNFEDYHVDSTTYRDEKGSTLSASERDWLNRMRALPRRSRASVLALADGYWQSAGLSFVAFKRHVLEAFDGEPVSVKVYRRGREFFALLSVPGYEMEAKTAGPHVWTRKDCRNFAADAYREFIEYVAADRKGEAAAKLHAAFGKPN